MRESKIRLHTGAAQMVPGKRLRLRHAACRCNNTCTRTRTRTRTRALSQQGTLSLRGDSLLLLLLLLGKPWLYSVLVLYSR